MNKDRSKAGQRLGRALDTSSKAARVYGKRAQGAQKRLAERTQGALEKISRVPSPRTPLDAWRAWLDYSVDLTQRSVLFWDTLRQRGNEFIGHTREGLKPVLHFDYETVLDARTFERPVNYALVRIIPPAGVHVDPNRRPYLIVDPRAGHGPGIGGFKDDSQVGVALRAGHPVYFVIFYRDPEPGQTLMDVCAAERRFVHEVRALHPDSPKPAIVGNCQGGWAAMMLAASDPDDTGPLVINGAPMSYWGGAWTEGEGDNPMRYAAGMLGGAWTASLAADLGNGKFDGAHLVQNFENLNPANTFWDKYYHLFANIDTEPPRYLEFERWWGGYYLMNREEIEWITQNLFVGNKLWTGTGEHAFDLKRIRSPIILFASMGDNITPPQQAFNWVVDTYSSTEEIKANGQAIVGLVHETIGHLGIFVSGKVAKKEHDQIVSVLKSIESLPPGLYGMHIEERKGADGTPEYEVSFTEHRLEDVAARLNRFERADEKPFETVAAISQMNQRLYELFAQPLVQAVSNETTATALRALHPLRFQRWAWSDANPFAAWVAQAADKVRMERRAVGRDHPLREAEGAVSDLMSASLDHYRALRDAATEAAFYNLYGGLYAFQAEQAEAAKGSGTATPPAPRELPFVKDALASIDRGGYAEAFARVAVLLQRKEPALSLARLNLRAEIAGDYADLLPTLPQDEWRRVRGEQEIIVHYEPERALETLPALLSDPADRERLLVLFERLLADRRVQGTDPTPEQKAMFGRIRGVLGPRPGRRRRDVVP